MLPFFNVHFLQTSVLKWATVFKRLYHYTRCAIVHVASCKHVNSFANFNFLSTILWHFDLKLKTNNSRKLLQLVYVSGLGGANTKNSWFVILDPLVCCWRMVLYHTTFYIVVLAIQHSIQHSNHEGKPVTQEHGWTRTSPASLQTLHVLNTNNKYSNHGSAAPEWGRALQLCSHVLFSVGI